MSEWFKEHAWKAVLLTLTDAQQHASTHVRSSRSRNNEVLRDVPVSGDVHRGFRGVCDTVLTQQLNQLPLLLPGTSTYVSERRPHDPAIHGDDARTWTRRDRATSFLSRTSPTT